MTQVPGTTKYSWHGLYLIRPDSKFTKHQATPRWYVCVLRGWGGGWERQSLWAGPIWRNCTAFYFKLMPQWSCCVWFSFPEIFLSWGALWYALKHHASAPENRSFTHIFFIIPCSKQRGTKRRKRQIEENEEPTTSNGSTNEDWKEK